MLSSPNASASDMLVASERAAMSVALQAPRYPRTALELAYYAD